MRRWKSWSLLLLMLAAFCGVAGAQAGGPPGAAQDSPEARRVRAARALLAEGDALYARGEIDAAIERYEQAQEVLAGDPVPAAEPLGCGSNGAEITPKASDFPGGAWEGYGIGTDETDALKNLLTAGFTAVKSYRKECKKECPDGSTPPKGQCVAVVTSSKPGSVKPADYGSRPWKVTTQKDGKVRIGPVSVSKLPADIKATPSCTACTKCAE
ncbi:MAG TPA: hypothetical protein VMW27_02655 [Thermoanaerobaculia bacterium]|nr:hypothetical protein [Thermoanaerobaculia bacterium]